MSGEAPVSLAEALAIVRDFVARRHGATLARLEAAEGKAAALRDQIAALSQEADALAHMIRQLEELP